MVANFTYEELNLIASALTKVIDYTEGYAKELDIRGYHEFSSSERATLHNVECLKEKVQQLMIME